MTVDPEHFYTVLASNNGKSRNGWHVISGNDLLTNSKAPDVKAELVNAFKAEVKRSYVKVSLLFWCAIHLSGRVMHQGKVNINNSG